MKLAKCLAVILVSAILGAIIWLHLVSQRSDDLARAFAQVQRGDSPERVAEIFRQIPTFISTNLQTNIDWNGRWDNTNGDRSVRQYHFCPPFSVCGEDWVVGFDERSHVVTKYQISSP